MEASEKQGGAKMDHPEDRWYYDITDAEWQRQLDALVARRSEDLVLLRGGSVVTLDKTIGDFDRGDVLIKGDKILDVGADLGDAAAGGKAIVVDVKGMVVIPGLIDGHKHCWQNQFRGLIVDASIGEYMATVHAGFAKAYEPEDMYVGDMVTTLGLLDCGVTTVLDLSHNTRSPAHTDAVFRAYQQAGIRAVHASSAPSAGSWDQHWPMDLERIRDAYHRPDGLTTVRMGLVEMRPWPLEKMVMHARDLGLAITMDGVCGHFSGEVEKLGHAKLLGPDVTLIHLSGITPLAWTMMQESGVRVTLATTSDEQIGLGNGESPVQEALDLGIRPSLSSDVEVSLAADMFTQMRHALSTQRMFQTKAAFDGKVERPSYITNRDVLEMCIVQGAQDLGLGSVTGSLTPGKFADIVCIAAWEFSNLPLNNAIGTIVQGTDRSTVRHVMVGGNPRKWNGKLVGQDIGKLRHDAAASRDKIAKLAGFDYTPCCPYHPVETAELAAIADWLRGRSAR
jgi:cytosine/adenosine deaminase-related metal-dependent hydrolase